MRKNLGFVIGFLVCMLIFTIPAYTAGTTTGNPNIDQENTTVSDDRQNDTPRGDAQPNRQQQIRNRLSRLREEYRERDCDAEFDTSRERIRCRLIQGEDYIAPPDITEEACRVLNVTNRGRCVAFYATVRACYLLDGRAKDKCFKRAVGLNKARLNEVPRKERPQKARDYVVALLYDLQERIEHMVDENKVDPDDAADIINKIVKIKQDILNGASKDVIRPSMQELRQMWREAAGGENE